MISRRGVAKKRREYKPGARSAKCSGTVATTQHSWRRRNHFWSLGGRRPLADVGWEPSDCPYCRTQHNPPAIFRIISRNSAAGRESTSTDRSRIARHGATRFAGPSCSITRPTIVQIAEADSNRVISVRRALFARVSVTRRHHLRHVRRSAISSCLAYLAIEQYRTRIIACGLFADEMRQMR